MIGVCMVETSKNDEKGKSYDKKQPGEEYLYNSFEETANVKKLVKSANRKNRPVNSDMKTWENLYPVNAAEQAQQVSRNCALQDTCLPLVVAK